MTNRRSVVLCGPLPPPVHGAAHVTLRIADELAASGAAVVVLRLGASGGARGLRVVSHLWSYIRAAARVASLRNPSVYVSLPGGEALWLAIMIVGCARFRGAAIFLHHHSYAYISRPSVAMKLVAVIAGGRSTHIVLTPGMAAQIQAAYPIAGTMVITNSSFVDIPVVKTAPERRDRKVRVLMFGNLSREKGLDLFAEVASELASEVPQIEFMLAGPIADPGDQALVDGLSRRLGDRLQVLGYVGGELKWSALRRGSVLLFPSKYVNEAAPLVIYEALRCGLRVFCTDVGACAEIVVPAGGEAFAVDQFAALTVERLKTLHSSPDSWLEAGHSRAVRYFVNDRSESETQLRRLVDLLCPSE
jgi:glycosyltransferase involved in cell wall biosynthesis